MEILLKADVFFFITSIFVIVLTVVLLIAGFYLVRMLKDFSDISAILKEATEETQMNLGDMANHVQESPIFSFIFGKKRAHRNHTRKEK